MIIYVDASNLAKTDYRSWSLALLEQALDDLGECIRHRDATLEAIADASLRHRFVEADRRRYEKLLDSGRVIQAPAAVVADVLLLDGARRNEGILVSNDLFRDHGIFQQWLKEPGKGRHVAAMFNKTSGNWSFFERYPLEGLPRSLSSVLDERSPRYETLDEIAQQFAIDKNLLRDYLHESGQITGISALQAGEIEKLKRIAVELTNFSRSIHEDELSHNIREFLADSCTRDPSLGINVGKRWFVTELTLANLDDFSNSTWNTLQRVQLKQLLYSDNSFDPASLSWALLGHDDHELVSLVRSWTAAFLGLNAVDWKIMELFDPGLPDLLVSKMVRERRIEKLAQLATTLLNTKCFSAVSVLNLVSADFLVQEQPSCHHLERVLRSWQSAISTATNTEALKDETTLLTDVRLRMKTASTLQDMGTQSEWIELGNLLSEFAPADDLAVICQALGGSVIKLASDWDLIPTPSLDALRTVFAQHVINLTWIDAQSVKVCAQRVLRQQSPPDTITCEHLLEDRRNRLTMIEGFLNNRTQTSSTPIAYSVLKASIDTLSDRIEQFSRHLAESIVLSGGEQDG